MSKSLMCMWIFLFLMWLMLALKVVTGMELLFDILWVLMLIGWTVSVFFELEELWK